jgi:diguanylate cyclase (GGDEF)-like protein
LRPFERSTAMAGVADGPDREPHQGASLRVLAVDDDPASLELIEALLAPVVRVAAAGSGEEALRLLEAEEYAAVLLDVGLPGIDGFELATRMKQRPATAHVPIIFLTGQIGEEQIRRGYAIGAADYLLKPFDPDILRAKVQVFVDLARLRLEASIFRYRSLHDQLTGLPNRTLFMDRLEHALTRIAREGTHVGVLFLDLDGFKTVNDRLGHDAGDRLLTEVAERLQTTVRATDTGARFGGDEFLVLVEGVHDREEVEEVADRIRDALDETRVSATVGIAITDDPDALPEDLVRAADEAMLREKAAAGRPERARPA